MIEKILTDKRFYVLSILSTFLPMFICLFALYHKQENLQEKAYKIESILKKAKMSHPQRKNLSLFLNQHSNADEAFIEEHLEKFSFLRNEKNTLAPLLSHPAFKNSNLSARYQFLEGPLNKLVFTEDQPKSDAICKETLIHQKREIELDKDDLVCLLNLIESNKEKKPQLLFKSFSLSTNVNNTFNLKMDLLKREF